MPMPPSLQELRLVLAKLASQPPDDILPRTLLEITQELISLSSLEDQFNSYIKGRRTCLLAGALRFSTKAPIHVVPAEILLDIFFFATAPDDDGVQHLSPDPLRWGILPISHVCRQWRTLALGTSALWTRITFDTASRGLRPLYIKRARKQPLDLICTDEIIESQASTRELNDVLTRCRTRSLSWHIEQQLPYNLVFGRLLVSAEQDLLHFCLSLSAPHKSLRPPWAPQIQRWCQSLRSMTLENACPSILPSSNFPELRTASLSYPDFATEEQPENFRVSQLQGLIRASPRLRELAIHHNPPILDVDHAQVVSHSVHCAAELRTLTWTSAPARDVWRIFHILAMPNLTELVLSLGTEAKGRRWLYFSGDTLAPPPSYNDLALHGLPRAIHLPILTHLRVDCQDSDALSCAFRRISFPTLEHLVLSYSGREPVAPALPPASRIFRDPRLVKLVHLEIRHFTLDAETLATLAYMQSLTTLSLYACPGSNAVICALSGYACEDEGSKLLSELPVRWLCPNLRELRLSHSATKFCCLEAAVRTRKAGVVAGAAPGTPPRAIRPLKKSALAPDASGSATPRKTPRKAAMQDVCASPNGSFVDGWRAHEATRPSRIRTIHVLGCKNISQVELWSLRFDQYGVESVSWCE